jgi:hypothetical protein
VLLWVSSFESNYKLSGTQRTNARYLKLKPRSQGAHLLLRMFQERKQQQILQAQIPEGMSSS